jgi:hypothetical protein
VGAVWGVMSQLLLKLRRAQKTKDGATKSRTFHCKTGVAALSLALVNCISSPLLANTSSCMAEIDNLTLENIFDLVLPSCSEVVAPWEIELHHNIWSVGFLTDGTSLGILHMPQRDTIAPQDRPLPIVLLPLSEHTWSVNELLDGQVLLDEEPIRFFLWTPGNSKSGYEPDGVDWGDAEARLFRCIKEKNEEGCVTHYAIPNCIGNDEKREEIVLSAYRKSTATVVEMLDGFVSTDKIAHAIVESAWASICGHR